MNTHGTRSSDVTFDVRATASGRLRTEIDLTRRGSGDPLAVFHMVTDECRGHGGESSAPPPLAHFAAALVGSLMSHIRRFARTMGIPVNRLTMNATMRWASRRSGDMLHEARPDAISIDIEIDSNASEGDLLRLIDLARQGCFIEQTLAQGVTVHHRLKRPGGWTSL